MALIKIDATDLPTIPIGNSDALRHGEWVLAIGSPYGLQNTITAGIVSAKGRSLQALPTQYSLESFIQTDAAVNPGNSGGALVNTKGELVGINTLIQSQTGSYIGYSFAVPTSIVKKVVVDLKEYGVVQRAMLGIGYNAIDEAFLESDKGKSTGIKEQGGIYVGEVYPGSAAEAAGIKTGDIITEINGVKIEGSAQVSEEIAKHRPNDKITVSVKRGSDVKQIEVVLRNKTGNTDVITKDQVSAYDALNGEFQQQMAAAFAEARAAGIRKPVMIGAIPFDTCQPSELYIPERWEAFSRPEKQRSARYAAPLEAMEVVERREIPEQDAFLAMVERAAALTATPEVDKVVLSRLIDITTRVRVDSGALMERLIAQNPASFNFHVPLSDGGVLLGASPELLLRKEGQHFSSLPLAGSARRQPDDVLDREAVSGMVSMVL